MRFGPLAPAPATADDALTRIAHAYLDFARDHPAVYDAMFTRTTALRFAAEDTPPQLTAAFAELRQAVGIVADQQDADTLTEVFWAALHGLVTLSRAGRLRPGHDSDRLHLLVDQFTEDDEADLTCLLPHHFVGLLVRAQGPASSADATGRRTFARCSAPRRPARV